MFRAIIFDFDGVIADTEPLHFRAFQSVLRGTQWEITEEQYFSRYLGLTDRAMLEKLTVDRATPLATGQLATLLQKKYYAYLAMIEGGIEPTSGLKEFLLTVPKTVPLAICSGARRKEIELILAHIGIRDRFAAIVSSEDVPTSKPDPTGYRLALRHVHKVLTDVKPEEVLAIEDSPLGIQAARAAGMRVMAIKPVGSAVNVSLACYVREDFRKLRFADLNSVLA